MLVEFLEDYENGLLGRREALKLIAGLVGSACAASALLAACAPRSEAPSVAPASGDQSSSELPDAEPTEPGMAPTAAEAKAPATEPPGDGPAAAEAVTVPGDDVDLRGYWARPEGYGPFWAVLVCHENRGLLEHIKDVTWRVAIGLAELRAAVPFYGPHPNPAELDSIRAAVLAIYAGLDNRINQSIPSIEERMRELGKTYEKIVYPEVDHAFHNDTGSRYDAEAATDAWARTLDWFGRYLVTA